VKLFKLVLVLPSNTSGGLEKVVTELAGYFVKKNQVEVFLICLMNGQPFYDVPEGLTLIKPPFSIDKMSRLLFLVRLMIWLRNKIKEIDPDSLMSFGGKFNSFVLLTVIGLKVNTYISDRSRPGISYGNFLDWINPLIYVKADGIIAQTESASKYLRNLTNHNNIIVIGNPVRILSKTKREKGNIILNVGRIISSKRQDLLVKYFARLNPQDWFLMLVGDGDKSHEVKDLAYDLKVGDRIIFTGETKEVENHYLNSSIFAFTSISEGFPNALLEAMAAGLACISFDCDSGPADLIEDGVDGYLIPVGDNELYISRLQSLMDNQALREKLGQNARRKAENYDLNLIGQKYLGFISGEVYENHN